MNIEKKEAIKIAFFYLIISILWIVFSDRAVAFFGVADNQLFFQTLKGVFFISLTAVLLYFLIQKSNDKISERDRQYKHIFYNSPLPMFVYEPVTLKFLASNNIAQEKYGYSEEEFQSLTLWDIRPKEDKEHFGKIIKEYKPGTITGIFRHKKKEGKIFRVNITSHVIKYGKLEAVMVIAEDIESRLQKEEENQILLKRIEEREKYLNSLIQSQLSYLIRIDRHGYFTFANNYFFQNFHYQELDVMGKQFYSSIVPEDYHKVQDLFLRASENPEEVIKILLRMPLKDQSRFMWTDWEFVPITDENGEVVELQGVGFDVTSSKIAESKIAYYSNTMEDILENISDGFFIISGEGTIQKVNKAFEQIVERKRERVIGKNIWELFPDAEETNLKKYIEKAIKTDVGGTFIEFFKPIQKWLDVKLYTVKTNIVIYIRDITRKKIAEQERGEYRLRLNNLLEKITDGFFTLDKEWKVTSANRVFEIYLGKTFKEVEGKDFWKSFPRLEMQVFEKFNQALRDNTTEYLEILTPVPNRWVNLHIYPTREGLVIFFKDIQEFKESQWEFQQLLDRYRLVAKATNDAIWDWDVENNVITGYESMAIFGYKLSEVEKDPKWWLQRIHPEDKKQIIQQIEEALNKGDVNLKAEHRFRCADGTYRYVSNRAFVLFDDQGKPIRIIGAIQDIHQRKMDTERIRDQVLRLRNVAWMQSHEVRKPVANILSLLDLIDPASLKNHTEIQSLEYLKQNARELDEMIQKIVNQTQDDQE